MIFVIIDCDAIVIIRGANLPSVTIIIGARVLYIEQWLLTLESISIGNYLWDKHVIITRCVTVIIYGANISSVTIMGAMVVNIRAHEY